MINQMNLVCDLYLTNLCIEGLFDLFIGDRYLNLWSNLWFNLLIKRMDLIDMVQLCIHYLWSYFTCPERICPKWFLSFARKDCIFCPKEWKNVSFARRDCIICPNELTMMERVVCSIASLHPLHSPGTSPI